MALMKYCNRTGCRRLVAQGVRYGGAHDTDGTEENRERHREYDAGRRDREAKAFYNSTEWKLRETAARLNFRKNSLNEFYRGGRIEGMARPRQPIDLIAAKGRKHLTLAEYEERKKSEVSAPADDIKAPSFLSKKERKNSTG